jgi:hypothetical protein
MMTPARRRPPGLGGDQGAGLGSVGLHLSFRASGRTPFNLVPFQFIAGDHVEVADPICFQMFGLDMPPEHRAGDTQLAGGVGQRHVVLHTAQSTKIAHSIIGYHRCQFNGQSAKMYRDTNVWGYGHVVAGSARRAIRRARPSPLAPTIRMPMLSTGTGLGRRSVLRGLRRASALVYSTQAARPAERQTSPSRSVPSPQSSARALVKGGPFAS